MHQRPPNANARVERFNRTLRREALDHFIFLSTRHIHDVATEFVAFYNGVNYDASIFSNFIGYWRGIDAVFQPFRMIR